MMIEKRSFVQVCLPVVLAAGSLAAQTELPPTFEFSFSNPGARSMGFGGAFAALADDATAAFANPAGLVQLVAPEFSIEGRFWSYSTPYVSGGRIWGPPTGIGEDSTAGLRMATSEQDLAGISFLSYVYPKDRWSLAFYRHVLSKYEFEGTTDGLYSGPWPDTGYVRREFAYAKTVDFEVVSYAAAAAYQLTQTLSLGLGIAYFEGDAGIVTNVHGKIAIGTPPEEFFAPIPIIPENLVYTETVRIADGDWGLNLGLYWRPTHAVSFGAFYREGPEFDAAVEQVAGPTYPAPGVAGQVIASATESLRLPNVYGLGASYRSTNDRGTLSFEWDRVEYSVLFAGSDELHIDDANEFHLGGEYAFLNLAPIVSVRAGIWLDPDHQLSANGSNYVANAVLTPGEDHTHYAIGFGLAFERFQLDLAADFSELVDTLSLSFIASF